MSYTKEEYAEIKARIAESLDLAETEKRILIFGSEAQAREILGRIAGDDTKLHAVLPPGCGKTINVHKTAACGPTEANIVSPVFENLLLNIPFERAEEAVSRRRSQVNP